MIRHPRSTLNPRGKQARHLGLVTSPVTTTGINETSDQPPTSSSLMRRAETRVPSRILEDMASVEPSLGLEGERTKVCLGIAISARQKCLRLFRRDDTG